MANREDSNTGTSTGKTGSTGTIGDWVNEDLYWRSNFASRPYTRADRGYEAYQPGYRYGFESAQRFRGREWDDIEPELRSGWDRYEFRGKSTWETVKDAVRDAWNRVTGKDRNTQTDRGTARPAY